MLFRRLCSASPNIRLSTNTICVICARSSRRCPAQRARGGGGKRPPGLPVRPGLRAHRDITSYPRHAHRPHCRTCTVRIKTAGIGPPIANTEAKVIDVITGAEWGPKQEGEICVRGPQVMKGYLNSRRPRRRWSTPRAGSTPATSALPTTTVVSSSSDRLKELIKDKGMQVAPAELEAVLLSHPSIADVAVIPIADEECGQVRESLRRAEADRHGGRNREFRRGRVAPYKQLRRRSR